MALLSENLAEVARNKIKLNILLFTVLAQKKIKTVIFVLPVSGE